MLVPAIVGTDTIRIYTTESTITSARATNKVNLSIKVSYRDVVVPRIVFVEAPE